MLCRLPNTDISHNMTSMSSDWLYGNIRGALLQNKQLTKRDS
jgi:hypothetical protein